MYNNLGLSYQLEGDWDKALEYQKKALSMYEKMKNKYKIPFSYTNLGKIYFLKGDHSLAKEYYQKGIEIVEERKITGILPELYYGLGELSLRLNDLEKALILAKKALECASKEEDKLQIGCANRLLGIICREERKWQEAQKWLEESIAIFERLRVPYELGQGYLEIGRLERDRGNIQLSQDFFKRAREIFEKLGAKKDLEKINKELK
ncbi:tetratricopeptide repeat protein [candidate division TA06 bacterium]|uniref:Tetratricopeptide repeat protein n=1 Tax=candidate division TA06 bacterium TaxID=2250710 RepID=A0A933IC21_UNCT6|nr:tetratricopeptide repeat protein [candidate division TA06 bacterium]